MSEPDEAQRQKIRARIVAIEQEIQQSILTLKAEHPPGDSWGQALIDAIGGELLAMLHAERRRRAL